MTRDEPSASKPFVLGYRPALDGLRGLAILAVLGVHLGISADIPRVADTRATRAAVWVLAHARGGYVGVQLFFVLSGFLITALLLSERDHTGTISFRSFYARRALRLFPAVLVVVAFSAVYAVTFRSAVETHGFWGDALGTLFYVANWAGATTPTFPAHLLSQTWSLAIEEQFYLVWPLTLVVALRRLPRRALLAVVVCGAALYAAERSVLWHVGVSGTRIYYGLDTRGDALLLGCALGLIVGWGWWSRVARRLPADVAGLGAAAILVAIVVGPERLVIGGEFDWVLLVSAAASAVLIWSVIAAPDGRVSRMLAVTPLVWIGRLSYSLYLWHFPVFVILSSRRTGLRLLPLLIVRLVVAFAAAACSYFAVERRFLRRKATISRQRHVDSIPSA